MCFIWLAPGAHQGRERKQQCCYFGDVFWQSDDYWFCQKHLQLFPLLWSKHCLHVKSPKNSNCGSCSRPTSTQAGAATHAHKRSSHPPAITISMKLKIVQPPPPQPLYLAASIGVVCMTVLCLWWVSSVTLVSRAVLMADWPSTWEGLEKLRRLEVFLRFWDPVEARMIMLRSTFAFSFRLGWKQVMETLTLVLVYPCPSPSACWDRLTTQSGSECT